MQISKQSDGTLQLQLSKKELMWFKQTLNECSYGFGVDNPRETLGADIDTLQSMMDEISSSYRVSTGREV